MLLKLFKNPPPRRVNDCEGADYCLYADPNSVQGKSGIYKILLKFEIPVRIRPPAALNIVEGIFAYMLSNRKE